MSAKSCFKEAVTQYCQFDEDAREILQSAFDDYNPFCNAVPEEKGKTCLSSLRCRRQRLFFDVTRRE